MGFIKWLQRRDESFGGSAGDPSGAGLGGPENGERIVTIEPNSKLDGSDRPPTTRNRKQKIVGSSGGVVFSKKKCNCQ